MEGKILVGAANPRLESLRAAIERSGADFELLTNVEDMPGLMAWADVAVAAAGITCWEMAVMGLPAAVLVVAENQLRIAEPLAEAGAVVNLGWHDRLTPEGIAAEVASLCRDQGRRRAQSKAGRRLVDGLGAERVVAVMRGLDGPLPEDQLRLRPAVPEDMLSLWRLVNQPTVRHNSLNSDPIPLDEHVRWFNQKLSSPDTCIWVLDLHGLILGPIRYDRIDAETAQISLHVAAPFRRRGLATRLLNLTWQDACRRLKVIRLRAVIKQGNTASERTFLKAGFRRVDSPVPSGTACHVLDKRA
jgi:RimJ/RimL family protein N-acetyltransferase